MQTAVIGTFALSAIFCSTVIAGYESATVTNLLKDYDPVIRPNSSGPVKVDVTLYFEEATWAKNQLNVYVYFRQSWNDAHFVRKNGVTRFPADRIIKHMWDPDTYFINAVDVKVVDNGLVEIKTNGDILWSQGIQFSIHCPMDAKRAYDNDGHVNCSISFQSYAYDAKDVIYSWSGKPKFSEDVDSIISLETTETKTKYIIGEWAGATVSLKIQTLFKKSVIEFVDETLFDKI